LDFGLTRENTGFRIKFVCCKHIRSALCSQAIDEPCFATHHFAMSHVEFLLKEPRPRVVGSLGSSLDLRETSALAVRESCDLAEIRLDLLHAEDTKTDRTRWSHLSEIPLLFTARRFEEGGALAIGPDARMSLLRGALDQAALIDIEVASIREMGALLEELAERQIPWIASYHDFNKLPATAALEDAARQAKDAGAAVFKAAAQLASPADLARLADFQLADHGIPVATMGMGPLAPVSRLLCAQSGSLLNYGYLGTTATAPGQWDAALLRQAIARLAPFRL
jgi:3-dehydroquinate dehydratase-1